MKYLKIKGFKSWLSILDQYKQENKMLKEHQDRVVNKFRLIKIGRGVLSALSANAMNQKIDREKNQLRTKLWGKVNTWLKELDQE